MIGKVPTFISVFDCKKGYVYSHVAAFLYQFVLSYILLLFSCIKCFCIIFLEQSLFILVSFYLLTSISLLKLNKSVVCPLSGYDIDLHRIIFLMQKLKNSWLVSCLSSFHIFWNTSVLNYIVTLLNYTLFVFALAGLYQDVSR